MGIPSADVLMRSQFVSDATRISISGTALGTASGAYTGSYLIYCASDVRFIMGTANTITLSGATKGTLLPGGTVFGPIYFDEASAGVQYINALTVAGGSDTLEMYKVT